MNKYTPVNKTEIIAIIPLIDCKPKGKSDDELPYVKLYKHVAKELGVEIQDINVSSVCLQPEPTSILQRNVKTWMRYACGYIKKGTRYYNSQLSMLNLMYGPVEMDEDWADNDHIYIRKLV